MNVGSVGNQQAWAEFIRATKNAQMRNPSLLQRTNPARQVKSPEKTLQARFAAPARFEAPGISNSTYAENQPKTYKRVLGNHFDGYA